MEGNQHLWDRFIWLGDKIGEGDLEPSELKGYNREYKRLMKILVPEVAEDLKKARQQRNQMINEAAKKFLDEHPCPECGGPRQQTRSGSKTITCTPCNLRWTLTSKKR